MYFTYNDEGIRTGKTVNNARTEYILNGSQILAEITDTYIIVYIYDAYGSPIGMQYKSLSSANSAWEIYWYEKNLQGDVIAVCDSTGTQKVKYIYGGAWGDHSTAYPNNGYESAARYNPFRYRGYYYDSDLMLYYLQSRYYDPNTCRFINADIPETLTTDFEDFAQYNLFVYCFNNPVNMSDETGTWPSWATKLAIGVGAIIIGAAVVAATAATGGAAAAFVGAAVAGLKAAAVSGAIGAAVGAGTSAVSHRVSTGSWSGAGKAAVDGAVDGFANGFMTGGIMAGGSQILSSGFKVAANAGVPTGRNGGLTIGNKVRVLSPNHPQAYEAGGTLLKIGSKYKNIRFDVGSNSMFHMNIQFAKAANYHLPIGILGSGLWGGIIRD